MPSFLDSATIQDYHNAINNHFDTFKRTMTVHKEPIKNIVQQSQGQMLGYDENSNIEEYTYTPRNQSFDAIIRYNVAGENLPVDDELKIRFPKQFVEIKVKSTARTYINTDRTEKITFDGKAFNVVSTDIVKNYQGLIYYIYYLVETK